LSVFTQERRAMTPSADRNLLFGLLALQTGMIEQSALVAAFHAWTRDMARSMAELLIEQGAIDADDRSALEILAAKHLKRHGDDIEKSLAVVPASRTVVTGLEAIGDADVDATIGHLSSPSQRTESDKGVEVSATMSMGAIAGDGQRFRVLRPHARGGLGEVFVALDAELNREVALKQILDHHADDPNSRTRFVLEAEITGGLEHPGIVPVYGLGSYGSGRPYYAMRFVRGDSLKDAIAAFHADPKMKADPSRRSLALRKLLRRFTDVCNAIEYAHTRGVIHRDIKPANVIVGKHGETLVVDWGLAKAIGKLDSVSEERTLMPSSSSGSAETLPGSAMGTPAYMSPEQAAGDLDKLGPRSDVYSLGATLYCLLTSKPPFEGEDLGAVLRAVGKGDFPPPRSLDASIDRALEAVCLKAMALKPENRYATPKVLADDVEQWAADEPVTAWREPLSTRAQRWGRRNRTAVTAGAVAVLAALFGTAAVLAVQTRANGELQKSNLALAAAKDRVKQRFDLADEAIKLYQGRVGEDLILKADQFKPLRDTLLKGAADFYNKLEGVLKDQPDRVSRVMMGNAYFELGNLTETIGDKPEALAIHRKGLAIRRELASESSTDVEAQFGVAKSLRALASLLSATGEPADALSGYEEARDLLEGLPSSGPVSDERRGLLGRVYTDYGYVLKDTGKRAAAMSAYERSAEILARLAVDRPTVTDFQSALAVNQNRMGILQSQTGKPAEAMKSYQRALAIRQKLTDDNPKVTEFRFGMAGCQMNIGNLQSDTGKMAEALDSYQRALAIYQKLTGDNPAVADFRSRQAINHTVIGLLQSQTGKPVEALESHKQAVAIGQKLVDDNPKVTEYQSHLAGYHYNMGNLLWQSGKVVEGMESVRQGLAIRQKLVDDNPSVIEFRSNLAFSHNDIGLLQGQTGKPAEALESYRRALAIRQKLVDDNPDVTDFRNRLADSHNNIGTVLSTSGKPAEALESYRRSAAIRQNLADDNPDVTDFRSSLAIAYQNIGELQSRADKPAEALESYRRARAIVQKLVDDNPNVIDYRNYLAYSYLGVANIHHDLGQAAEARDGYEQAIAIREALVKASPNVTDYRSGLGSSIRGLGLTRLAAGDAAGAVADCRKAVALFEGLPTRSAEEWYEEACCHAVLAAAGRDGSGMSASDGMTEASKAMTLLRKAMAAGNRDTDAMTGESALDPLRNRPDFKLLMLDMAFPADPFAK
jgi:eukaryotic-like serine/threonine-protein kinase